MRRTNIMKDPRVIRAFRIAAQQIAFRNAARHARPRNLRDAVRGEMREQMDTDSIMESLFASLFQELAMDGSGPRIAGKPNINVPHTTEELALLLRGKGYIDEDIWDLLELESPSDSGLQRMMGNNSNAAGHHQRRRLRLEKIRPVTREQTQPSSGNVRPSLDWVETKSSGVQKHD